MTRHSWQSYLIATGQFAEWVDRGRPAPTHRRWSQYLRWVADNCEMNVISGEVHRDFGRQHGRRAAVGVAHGRDDGARRRRDDHRARPGRAVHTARQPAGAVDRAVLASGGEHELIAAERVAVIGGGETAASMLNELFRHRVSTITVISPQVTLFTRGEGFFENTLFSDPTGWTGLTLAERRDALARTDRGVFSARVQDALLADDRIRHLRGRVAHAVARDGRIRLTLSTNQGGENLETVHGFDLVIDGSGADALWFVPLFGQDALDLLELGLGGLLTGDSLQESIGHDLAITESRAETVPARPVRAHPGPGLSEPELPGAAVRPDTRAPTCPSTRHRRFTGEKR